MRRRPISKYRPALEQFEVKQLLSASPLTAHAADIAAQRHSSILETEKPRTHLPHSFLGFRVTNPSHQINYVLVPPFIHTLVQTNQPVPGETYNLLQIAVRNGTSQTFTASNGFTARLNTNHKEVVPILTGTEQWKPGQVVILYILTKKYYPLPQTYGGFQLDLGGRSSTLVPGPSAIFLRLKYNPATFDKTLNVIVTGGVGNQGGLGTVFGIPNTSINNIVATNTKRNDYGGHF